MFTTVSVIPIKLTIETQKSVMANPRIKVLTAFLVSFH